jgi:DNA helicase TIP49 (TBP-interacting protein)
MALIDGIEVRDMLKVERVGAHSHITGLGLSDKLEPQRIHDGMVAQVCFILVLCIFTNLRYPRAKQPV